MKRCLALGLAAIVCLCLAPPAHAQFDACESLSYLYAGNTSIYLTSVERTKDNLTTVCPDYFQLSDAGQLKLSKPVDPLFVSTMHTKGIRVVPFFSNHWDRAKGRAGLTNRAQLADALAAQVVDNHFDGLDVDIENLTEVDKDNFTDFIRLLRAALPSDKSLSVCVAANPYSWKTGWQGSYDYAALAAYVDHLFVMTYDESYPGGPPGPVSSQAFVEKSIQYALQSVPAGKVMIGIPFYGRYWIEGEESGGLALTVSDIERLLSTYQSTTWYDSDNQCARATMTISQENVTDGLWGGKKLKAGVYDIWYENAASYKKKLSLVKQYGLKGAGSWALGQEPAYVWDSYRLWLCGLPFQDIAGNWAESHIVNLHENDLVTGKEDEHFVPDGLMTRAEAAAMICRILGKAEESGSARSFTDMNTHWARGYVATAAREGYIKGFPDQTFRPDKPIARQELAVLLDRVIDLPDTVDLQQNFYRDVSPESNSWSNNAIVRLSVHNVISGYPDGTFRPKNNITRAEASKLFDLAQSYMK